MTRILLILAAVACLGCNNVPEPQIQWHPLGLSKPSSMRVIYWHKSQLFYEDDFLRLESCMGDGWVVDSSWSYTLSDGRGLTVTLSTKLKSPGAPR